MRVGEIAVIILGIFLAFFWAFYGRRKVLDRIHAAVRDRSNRRRGSD